MQIQLTGRNLEITPAIRTFTDEKLAHLAQRDHIAHIHVILHVEHVTNTAEATLRLGGTDLHARAEASDMYAAIEMLADKITGQVNKHKDKHSDHRE